MAARSGEPARVAAAPPGRPPGHVRRGGSHRAPDGEGHRLTALDGIRCFAVLAVMLYHAGVPGVGGGLLGVDVFFVLSGFLITSLLCDEHRLRSTIHLARFWGRRARRLLPALFLLLLGVAAYAWWYRQSLDVASIRGDAVATLLYVANWRFVFSHQGYFAEAMAPSPLLHMWSLGVEEQFYLVWPLVTLAVLSLWGRRRLVWVAAGGATASAALTASLYHAGFSTDRLYYGTDTRAQALLVGATLGAVAAQRSWHVLPPTAAATRRGRVLLGSLGTLGVLTLLWCWHTVQGQGAFLYDGGFLLVALAAGAVLTVVTTWRTSALARFLALPPIAYVGRISYGLYVYHWPLFLVIDQAHTSLSGAPLLTVRLAATFAVAVASFHLVEQPIRRGGLLRAWRGFTLAVASATVVAAVVVVATVPPVTAATDVSATTGLPAVEHRQLAAAGAFGAHPVRFLMVGDSVSVTAAVGLSTDGRQRYGIRLINDGTLGCNLDRATESLGGVTYPGDPGAPCWQWQKTWRKAVARYRPDVVGLLIGRFELANYHLSDGRWAHVGEKGWDRRLEGELDQAVRILSAGGARVALFTFPYVDPPDVQPDGDVYPENEPSRVDAWNRLIREAAASHRRVVTLVDLHRMLDPGGHFAEFIDGIRVRWRDTGIHITRAGGRWLQPKVMPEIAALGLAARRHGS